MQIHQVDLTDESAVRTWYRVGREVHDHDRPGTPFWTEDEAVALLRPDDPEERFVPLLAVEGAEPVGFAVCFVPLLDNLDKVYVWLAVRASHRGRGAGDRLVEAVLGVVGRERRGTVIADGHLPVGFGDDHPVCRFAARNGFTVANVELRRTLDLPVPVERLHGLAAEAARHHEGYAILTYVDRVPAQLRASLVHLHNQLALDAPTGDLDFEAGGTTVEVFEQQTERRIATGRTVLTTLALRDGEVVAHSTLSVPPGDAEMPHVQQWGTYVHRDHRGHRLGLAVKVANLLALQERHPERTVLHTQNSPANGPMVAVNELLGFRPVEASVEFVRHV
ncbi:MAG: GNAT family N-acetyltransferase [Nocardioidaceae bacterium]